MLKTDYHCHILPGIDDGAQTLDEAVALAGKLVEWGFGRAVCTSHIAYRYRNTSQSVGRACDLLGRALRERGIALELVPSAEYRLLPETWEQVVRNGWFMPWDEKYILMELPIRAREQLGGLEPVREIERVQALGFVPVIAHPERYAYLSFAELQDFCSRGALLQVNYPSLCGKYGEETRQRAQTLCEGGYASFYGTDLHSAEYVPWLDGYFRRSVSLMQAGSGV